MPQLTQEDLVRAGKAKAFGAEIYDSMLTMCTINPDEPDESKRVIDVQVFEQVLQILLMEFYCTLERSWAVNNGMKARYQSQTRIRHLTRHVNNCIDQVVLYGGSESDALHDKVKQELQEKLGNDYNDSLKID